MWLCKSINIQFETGYKCGTEQRNSSDRTVSYGIFVLFSADPEDGKDFGAAPQDRGASSALNPGFKLVITLLCVFVFRL